jgi:hypothetical protein
MRAFFALVLLGALAAPSSAHEWGGGYGYRGYRHDGGYGYRGYRGYRYRAPEQPYWHHPYYARFGYQRPYLYYRQLRTFGYVPYASGPFGSSMWGGCGGGGAYSYTYYPAYVSVAPIYSRLGVALTLDDPVFSKRDPDGLPRARTEPVGGRFLSDIR